MLAWRSENSKDSGIKYLGSSSASTAFKQSTDETTID